MPYNLFIDDERFPADNGKDWIIARTLDDVKEIVEQRGLPLEISWDHDLGENQPTGFDIAKWMVDQELADLHRFPDFLSTCILRIRLGKPISKTISSITFVFVERTHYVCSNRIVRRAFACNLLLSWN
jgi:hypothetical protein